MATSLTPEQRAARLLHYRATLLQPGDPLTPPLVQASAFHLPDADAAANAPYIYGRNASPTIDAVEHQLALLEGAPSVAFPSGMAAICAVCFAALKAGDRVMIPSDGYHATRAFARRFLTQIGVQVTECATTEMTLVPLDGYALIMAETPSNPLLDVCDLRLLATRAHAAGALLAVDNTAMTPYFQRPLDLGADIVIAADTKAPGGHSDLLFGHVATRDAIIEENVREWRKLSGSIPGPYEAWLVHRGLETLEVRLARMCMTAGIVAERLAAHPAVSGLRYPGLADDPSHALARRQMDGFGFLISFHMTDVETAEAFLAQCPFLAQATSFGGVHSSAERRHRWGDAVDPGFVRLSIGVEPTEILWDAIDAALGEAIR